MSKLNISRGQKIDPLFFLKSKFILCIVCVVGIVIAGRYLNTTVLRIVPVGAAGPKITVDIVNNEWLLRYTHSVQKTTVDECFRMNTADDTFLMYRTLYSSFGVGLPFLATDGRPKLTDDGRMCLDIAKPRVFPVVNLWTGIEAKVVLITGDKTIPLYELYPTGTLVSINAQKRYKILF